MHAWTDLHLLGQPNAFLARGQGHRLVSYSPAVAAANGAATPATLTLRLLSQKRGPARRASLPSGAPAPPREDDGSPRWRVYYIGAHVAEACLRFLHAAPAPAHAWPAPSAASEQQTPRAQQRAPRVAPRVAWSQEELAVLVEAQRGLGNSWTEIATRLPNRTNRMCKNRFNAHSRKAARRALAAAR